MGESKKTLMREYWQDNPGADSSEVAGKFETNPSYARRCKPEELKGTSQHAPGRELEATESDPEQESNPLSELVIEDTHDEYECGECNAEVEYLSENCSECGEELVWARGVDV